MTYGAPSEFTEELQREMELLVREHLAIRACMETLRGLKGKKWRELLDAHGDVEHFYGRDRTESPE